MGLLQRHKSQAGDHSACFDVGKSDWQHQWVKMLIHPSVIVGAGPAGLMLAACLARWGYSIRHIDNRTEPTPAGRADGIQPRSLDLLCNMGLKPAIMAHDPARIYESAFWAAAGHDRGIARTGTWPSCPDFINARHPFTTLLHQGRIENVFIADLAQRGVQIQRPWTVTSFETSHHDAEYPIVVRMAHVHGTASETVHAKYLFSAEGARSLIRKQLGIKMRYREPTTCTWAVIDGRVRTDFPDIKMSCSIHSENGSAMVIPRERDMVRLYVRLSATTEPDWDPTQTATESEIQQLVKKMLTPYCIEWEHVEWFSTYRIRQGIASRFSLDQRVFLGGDACHTHSPKAGQGMNTAFADSQNLAWKIHMVECGFAHRDILKTYEHERRGVAHTLIDFDNQYAKLYSQLAPAAREGRTECEGGDFAKAYRDSRAFVSGHGIRYGGNMINWSADHAAGSPLFQAPRGKLAPGQQFITADVTRVVDANPVHLEQVVPLNGSFRIFVFAGHPPSTSAALLDLSHQVRREGSFFTSNLRRDMDSVSWHERHNPHSHLFTICLVFAAERRNIEISELVPAGLADYSYHVYADAAAQAHGRAGMDPRYGGVVVVRPDGYVGAVVRLVEGAGTAEALNDYFAVISRGHDSIAGINGSWV